MAIKDLQKLLERNEMSLNQLHETIYETMKLSIFETICLQMKNKDVRQRVLSMLRKSSNQTQYIKRLSLEMTGCALSDEESGKILEWLIAHFRKNPTRKRYPISLKKELLNKQHHTCNICLKSITLNTCELDHVIPWDFVGDELDSNLQLLCCTCNERKGRSIYFQLNMLMIKHKNDKHNYSK